MSEYGRNGEIIIFITYRGSVESRFDRAYYLEKHLPMMRRIFSPLGLISAEPFFPHNPDSGVIALCECRYQNEDALKACFQSPEVPGLAADIGRFTDIMPMQVRGTRW